MSRYIGASLGIQLTQVVAVAVALAFVVSNDPHSPFTTYYPYRISRELSVILFFYALIPAVLLSVSGIRLQRHIRSILEGSTAATTIKRVIANIDQACYWRICHMLYCKKPDSY